MKGPKLLKMKPKRFPFLFLSSILLLPFAKVMSLTAYLLLPERAKIYKEVPGAGGQGDPRGKILEY